ncbi:MAG: non-lysosomal glucosylceramidase [Armatimonadetes bacterium]|nr:non-lysosomal glucosylceramidase [Armatimonadota bacterium]
MEFEGERLKVFAFPLGGVGSGNLSFAGKGQLVAWQIVNNFNSGAHGFSGAIVPLTFFAAWAKQGRNLKATLLQTAPVHDLPTVKGLRAKNKFPILNVRYETDLPVEIELEAWSPFIPLNAKDSATPVAVFTFTLHNPTKQTVEAAVMMNLQNIIGWEGYRPLDGLQHEEFVGNFNTVEQTDGWTTILCQAKEGEGDSFDEPIQFFTPDREAAWLMRLSENLTVRFWDWSRGVQIALPSDLTNCTVWLNDLPDSFTDQNFVQLLEAVEQGANLVLCGTERHPLAVLDLWAKASTDVEVFADFESGTYEGWTIEGNCFGERPATGKINWQQPVSGWRGKYFVNTFNPDDTTTGRAISRPFKITKRFIHFLIGGGNHPRRCCLNLLVDGKVVRTATGRNSEQLFPERWDVSEFIGKEAQLEIVDMETGSWGHILVDHIVFSDSPIPPFADAEVAQKLLIRLPIRWRELSWRDGEQITSVMNGSKRTLHVKRFWQLVGVQLDASAQVLAQTPDGSPLIVRCQLGKGKLLIVFGSPYEWTQVGQRKSLVGMLIAEATQTRYTPMTGWRKTAPAFGTMALAVAGDKRGWQITTLAQHDDVKAMWKDFAEDGSFNSALRTSHSAHQNLHSASTEAGQTCCGSVSAKVSLKPNERRSVTFVLAWHFPNRYRTERYGWAPPYEYRYRLGNRYNAWFKDAKEVVRFFIANREGLYRETKTFADALWENSLPESIKDAVASNLAILRSGVLMWLEDGNFYGFEGADSCCPLICTHVYNYAQSIAFVFPELERTMRFVEWKFQQHPEKGYIPHRVIVPLDLPRLWERGIGGPYNPALDGMLGAVLKTYREFRLSGDVNWLVDLFPHVAKLMRHIFEQFDPNGDGVIDGEQPNTYDIHTFGSNTFIGTLYLAALKAVEQMILALPDDALRTSHSALLDECRKRFELGREGYIKRCWNGEFFINAYDAPNVSPEVYEQNNCWGIGCHSDQLLGQWWAFVLDLGYLLPEDMVKTALWSIFRYNWRKSLRGFKHNQRVFAEGDESGLLTCTWPNGGRPQRPILYCDEVWTGLEYEVAAMFLWNGMVEEALKIVEGARNRYRGDKRNPFAEVECGHYYIRALSSWSLLLAAAGFVCDAYLGKLQFAPNLTANEFRFPFFAGTCWGLFSQTVTSKRAVATCQVLSGEFALRELCWRIGNFESAKVTFTLNGKTAKAQTKRDGDWLIVQFTSPILLKAGTMFRVELK